jgi:hypothetical protein
MAADTINMNTKTIAFLATGAVLILGILGFILGYYGFSSTANQFENGIVAQYSENQNNFDNGWKSVKEAAQVPTQQADQLKGMYLDVAQGLKSPGQLVLALGQFNPNMDQATYRKVQQLIESFHNSFAERQMELVARKQQYQNYLTVSWGGRFYNQLAHYPHIDMGKYDIVTSQRTDDTFRTKKSDELNVFGK